MDWLKEILEKAGIEEGKLDGTESMERAFPQG